MHVRHLPEERKMPVVAPAQCCARDPPSQPPPLRGRHHQVSVALENDAGHGDVREIDASRPHEGQVVIAEARGSGRQAQSEALQHERASVAGEDRPVKWGEDALPCGEQPLGVQADQLLGVRLVLRRRSGVLEDEAERLDVQPPIPARKSSPSAPNGPTDAKVAMAATRSGASAAHARACGPPPESPDVTRRSTPCATAIARRSATRSATALAGSRVEPPWPGRS